MKGLFDLRTSRDLFAKLEEDFARLKADLVSSHVAYDFCVTAWHLAEWHIRDTVQRNVFCDRNQILRVCEHIAVGAKHFEPTNPKLASIRATENHSVWASGTWSPCVWQPDAWNGVLVIHLDGEARRCFGDSIAMVDLADRVMTVWKAEF